MPKSKRHLKRRKAILKKKKAGTLKEGAPINPFFPSWWWRPPILPEEQARA